MKFQIFVLVIYVSLNCFAQNRVGNGGDVIVCEDSKTIKKIQLLDFYEEPKNIILKSDQADAWAIAESRFKKIAAYAPKLSTQYLDRLKQIRHEFEFKPNVVLADVKDSEHLFMPYDKKCRLQQIAIRKNLSEKSERRFLVNQKLWQKLSPIHQAGLISHEIVYEHFFKLGEPNSIKARKLNRALFSDLTEQTSFWKLIKELEIQIYP